MLSICIVNYQARDYLNNCLRSIIANPPQGDYEIIVVDNGSTDGSVKMLQADFPKVTIIENPANLGFTAPMNQALRRASGQFLLLLNPDTLIHPQAFDRLIAFMQEYPQVGICGPKVLNTDGSLQAPCRRGESRPWAVISYFLGLHRLFPNSRLFGGYLLNYMGEDVTHEVAGVAGSCMLIRRQVVDQIGYLDERFLLTRKTPIIASRRAGQDGRFITFRPHRLLTLAARAARACNLTAPFTHGIAPTGCITVRTWPQTISSCSTGPSTWRCWSSSSWLCWRICSDQLRPPGASGRSK